MKPLSNFELKVSLKGNYEHSLFNFISNKTVETRLFSLQYYSDCLDEQGFSIESGLSDSLNNPIKIKSGSKFRDMKKIKAARNELIRQGLLISFYNWDLLNAKFGDLCKVVIIGFTKKQIVNLSCFDYEIYYRKYEKGKDENGLTWFQAWEQTYNYWLQVYYPIIKNEL